MGAADIILDLVSTGVTLRENNLKTITNGDIMQVSWSALPVCYCASNKAACPMTSTAMHNTM